MSLVELRTELGLEKVVIFPKEISQKKLFKISKCFKLDQDDKILALINDTNLKTYRRGIVFTERKLIWRSIFEFKVIFFKDIEQLSVFLKKDEIHIQINNIEIALLLTYLSNKCDLTALEKLIKAIISGNADNNEMVGIPENKNLSIGLLGHLIFIEMPYLLIILSLILFFINNDKGIYGINPATLAIIASVGFISGILILLFTIPLQRKESRLRQQLGKSKAPSFIFRALSSSIKTISLFIFAYIINSIANADSNSGTKKETNVNIKKQIPNKFFCMYCGSTYSSISTMTSFSCRKSPTGNHVPYEGSEKSKYICKYCGSSYSSISTMTSFSCKKSPTGNHVPMI